MEPSGEVRYRLEVADLEALGKRLVRLPRFLRQYCWWKVRMDPVYALALPHLCGASQVVDLGSGVGLLPVLLAHRSPQARIRAVEWDEAKVAAARKLVADLEGVEVIQGDARTAPLPKSDAIVLFDILHYSDVSAQRDWLRRVTEALRPGGRLLIRELDGRGSIASGLERIAVRFGWNQASGVRPRPVREIAADLEALGLTVETVPAGRGFFKANALLIAGKRQA
jgi:SAM-dependent methyltransferase